MSSAWWLRRSIATAVELLLLTPAENAREALAQFEAAAWVKEMTGPLPDEPTMALAQFESMAYLRNQLLRDSAWASMDHSVEQRTPLVDAHLLDRLTPYLASFDQFPGKQLLAQAPKQPLPAVVTQRKKMGFGIPVQQWLADQSRQGKQATPGLTLSGWAGWMRQIVEAYSPRPCTASAGLSTKHLHDHRADQAFRLQLVALRLRENGCRCRQP